MNVILAIIQDTWRQSLNQVVFTIMLVVFALIGIAAFATPKVYEQPNGVDRAGWVFSESTAGSLEGSWEFAYVQARLLNAGQTLNPFEEEPEELREKIQALSDEARDSSVPLKRRSAEMMAQTFTEIAFTLGMWFFIMACGGYMPAMLESGAVDIVLARPAHRAKIYLGKIVGGLALFTAANFAMYLLIFVALGIRTGEWVGTIFLVLPLQILTAAVLYSLLALLGLLSRSSVLCILVGLFFYILVDTGIAAFIQLARSGLFEEGGWVYNIGSILYWVFPNFSLLKGNATLSVISVPVMNWQPFIVAFGWLALTLGLGLWRFQKTDF